jgi:alpha-beta hydrolase superfamily lysophospholipase
VGSADETLKLYDRRFHDPFNDIGTEEVVNDIPKWIETRTAADIPP